MTSIKIIVEKRFHFPFLTLFETFTGYTHVRVDIQCKEKIGIFSIFGCIVNKLPELQAQYSTTLYPKMEKYNKKN